MMKIFARMFRLFIVWLLWRSSDGQQITFNMHVRQLKKQKSICRRSSFILKFVSVIWIYLRYLLKHYSSLAVNKLTKLLIFQKKKSLLKTIVENINNFKLFTKTIYIYINQLRELRILRHSSPLHASSLAN